MDLHCCLTYIAISLTLPFHSYCHFTYIAILIYIAIFTFLTISFPLPLTRILQRDITMQLTEGQLNRLLKRPEDDEDNVKNTLKVYRQIMLPLLQDFMAGKMRGWV